MTTIAFLGLGHMGGPMVANLVAAGHTVRGFDPVAALSEAAADKGAQVFDSGAQAASEADVVITSLPNGDIVKAVLRRGAAGRSQAGPCSSTPPPSPSTMPATIHAQAAERRARSARRAGLRRGEGCDGRHAGVHGRR